MIVRIAPAGDDGLLVELPSGISASELHEAARFGRGLPGVTSCTTGYSSLLLSFSASIDRNAVAGAFANFVPLPGKATTASVIHHLALSIHPGDAPDLEELLWKSGTTRAQFVATLAELQLTARFLGFRAGFAYLDGIPSGWEMPRRAATRSRVPAGSFAIAGTTAAFYPVESPGGWNLIGRTDAPLWEPGAEQPNRIAIGDVVMLEPTEERLSPAVSAKPRAANPKEGPFAEIIRAGSYTAIVPKRELTHILSGGTPGGPFHIAAAEAANLAAGNAAEATILECAQVGPAMRIIEDALLAWSGAEVMIRFNGTEVPVTSRFAAAAGDVLEVGRMKNGFRGYLAVAGGYANDAWPELTANTLDRGALLSRGNDRRDANPRWRPVPQVTSDEVTVVAGPHQVSDALLEWIASRDWKVTPNSNRVAVRFHCGDSSSFAIPGELRSCGMTFGTVQLHPSGEIVAMGPDHPVTGGYLQVMTVIAADRWKLGQLAPGDSIRWKVRREERGIVADF
ncbi:MAG: carboxyltransferase domain-containing protein [Acidobacteriota bacterium]